MSENVETVKHAFDAVGDVSWEPREVVKLDIFRTWAEALEAAGLSE